MEVEVNSDTIVADIVLDTKGLSSPMPLLKTQKALSAMAPGEIREVVATDPSHFVGTFLTNYTNFQFKWMTPFATFIVCLTGWHS